MLQENRSQSDSCKGLIAEMHHAFQVGSTQSSPVIRAGNQGWRGLWACQDSATNAKQRMHLFTYFFGTCMPVGAHLEMDHSAGRRRQSRRCRQSRCLHWQKPAAFCGLHALRSDVMRHRLQPSRCLRGPHLQCTCTVCVWTHIYVTCGWFWTQTVAHSRLLKGDGGC